MILEPEVKAAALTAELPDGGGDFRLFLQNELLRRCKVNPRYSLRAFARSLGIEPSALSKLLAGKRSVSRPMFSRLSARLGLDPRAAQRFAPPETSEKKRAAQAAIHGDNFSQISLDAFQVIADWYHFALLELMTVEGFQPDPAWIARALGLSLPEVRFAIERLVRLGLLEITASGEMRRLEQVTTIGPEFTNAALRKVQRQVLEMAMRALEEVPIEQRDQSAMTMAVNLDRLPAAKEKIKAFRRRLCAFLEAEPPKGEVYHLSISLYPVTDAQGANEARGQARRPGSKSRISGGTKG